MKNKIALSAFCSFINFATVYCTVTHGIAYFETWAYVLCVAGVAISSSYTVWQLLSHKRKPETFGSRYHNEKISSSRWCKDSIINANHNLVMIYDICITAFVLCVLLPLQSEELMLFVFLFRTVVVAYMFNNAKKGGNITHMRVVATHISAEDLPVISYLCYTVSGTRAVVVGFYGKYNASTITWLLPDAVSDPDRLHVVITKDHTSIRYGSEEALKAFSFLQ